MIEWIESNINHPAPNIDILFPGSFPGQYNRKKLQMIHVIF